VRCRRCGHDNEHGAQCCSACGAAFDVDEDSTATLALVENRESLAAELGEALDQLPEGLGMLIVRRGPNAGSTFVLQGDETTLGRHPDSDVFLDDVTVSRRHATLRRIDGGYEVADVGSLNGTYVDHERVDAARLRDMQELQVGRFVLTFVIGGAAGRAPGSAP
jgi:pSer/pThr/pTyr-binding forkhead associated (FHA) protein